MTGNGKRQRSSMKTGPCSHYWLVGPQGAPTSLATWKHCGVQREFANTGEACIDDEMRRYPAKWFTRFKRPPEPATPTED